MTTPLLRSLCCMMLTMLILSGCKNNEEQVKNDDVAEQVKEVSTTIEEEVAEVEPCPPDGEHCRVERMGAMKIGWLEQGVPVATVIEQLGEPDQKEERFTEEATGDIYEIWTWKEKGVQADLQAPDMTSDVEKVRYFTVSAPFDGKTERGIGIGSTKEEVIEAYGGQIEPRSLEDDTLIVGSVYGGIFITVVDGKVATIFMGAGAE